MSNEHDELQDILANESGPDMGGVEVARTSPTPQVAGESDEQSPSAKVNFSQWEIGANDCFGATGGTRSELPPGVYRLGNSPRGLYFSRVRVMTDKLIDLKDSASSEIIAGIRTFWASEAKFKARGILYKRGVLLWGPPGSGKTVTVSLLINDLVSEGGMVILCESPDLTVAALQQVRRIEPDRRLIVVEEDIEEMMRHHGEHSLLALLDGENQIANVVHVATTNYPDQLGARIVNRPSRFDEVKKIGMPNAAARAEYFIHTVGQDLDVEEMARWIADTDDMSIAHLRELVVAVFCLGRGYEETLERLKKMQIRTKSHEDGFRRSDQIGMGASGNLAKAERYVVTTSTWSPK